MLATSPLHILVHRDVCFAHKPHLLTARIPNGVAQPSMNTFPCAAAVHLTRRKLLCLTLFAFVADRLQKNELNPSWRRLAENIPGLHETTSGMCAARFKWRDCPPCRHSIPHSARRALISSDFLECEIRLSWSQLAGNIP